MIDQGFMTSRYNQEVEKKVTKMDKKMQIWGVVFVLLSFGFLVLSIFGNWLFLIPFLFFLATGIGCQQVYINTTTAYIYELSETHLIFAKKSIMNKTKTMAVIELEKIELLEVFSQNSSKNDIVATPSVQKYGVMAISAECDSILTSKNKKQSEINYDFAVDLAKYENETKRQILFSPDTYMIALLQQKLGDKVNVECDFVSDLSKIEMGEL